ncbi:MAG: OmpA family protein [Hyphomicrobiaceae bacterium]|nr:OmpA family protein [Hyphomicrobiaceae bacterium]
MTAIRMGTRRAHIGRSVVVTALLVLPTIALVQSRALAQAGVGQAKGAPLPNWKINEICAKDSARGQCEAFEARAWRAVSGSWAFIPDKIRTGCVGAARNPADQSWRILGECVETSMASGVDQHAVMTARTPSEAVPPPKVVAQAATPPPTVAPVAPPTVVSAPVAAVVPAAPAAVALPAIAPPPVFIPTVPAAPAVDVAAEAAKQKATADAALAAKAAADAKVAAEKAAADAALAAKVAADAKAATEAKAAAEKAAADAKAKAEADSKAKALAEAKVCVERIAVLAKAGTIRFAFGKADLVAESAATLDKIAVEAKACPNVALAVEGHTDSVGDAGNNQKLSEARAAAVSAALVQRGVVAARVTSVGLGATKPIADNTSAEGRTQNRRIEFTVR